MNRNHGFTLIELIVVLAFVCIIANVVWGAISNHRSDNGQHSINAQRVEDHPNLDNCKALQDDNRVIYSCPDGKIYTK